MLALQMRQFFSTHNSSVTFYVIVDVRGGVKMVKTITSAEYATLVEQAAKPVVLEFGADW